jgi:hypothetical protein
MSRSSMFFIILFIGYIIYDYSTDASRDQTGNIISEGDVDAFSVRIGDCFNDAVEVGEEESVVVEQIAGLPCTEPHDNEIYTIFNSDIESFPGNESMAELAHQECLERFPAFAGIPYDDSILDVFFMYPTSESWTQMDDREIVCAVFHLQGEKLHGSMNSAGI